MFSKKRPKPAISVPSNFEHRVHTGYDPVRGAFVGLPAQWAGVVDPAESARPRPIVDPSFTTPVKVATTVDHRAPSLQRRWLLLRRRCNLSNIGDRVQAGPGNAENNPNPNIYTVTYTIRYEMLF